MKLKQKTLMPGKDLKRENSGGSVWESFDGPAKDHGRLLSKVLAGQTVVIRCQERDGIEDITLAVENLREMRDVLLVYRYLGGKWRDD